MDLSTFIVAVFCLIDGQLKDLGRLRARCPPLALFDSDVPTIEVVGGFLRLDEDTEPFEYFRRHYGHFFPKPGSGGSMCVIVPLCTESRLHFSVRLDDGAPEVRFERVTLG
jgi:hypothetical protein